MHTPIALTSSCPPSGHGARSLLIFPFVFLLVGFRDANICGVGAFGWYDQGIFGTFVGSPLLAIGLFAATEYFKESSQPGVWIIITVVTVALPVFDWSNKSDFHHDFGAHEQILRVPSRTDGTDPPRVLHLLT